MSFKPEVQVYGESKWCGNALRFPTYAEAEKNVRDLSMRWLLVDKTRVVEVDEPANYNYTDGKLIDIE